MSETMQAVVYVLVDDNGLCTAGEDQAELWSVHESKGGYSALQLYELTITLPKPRGCIEVSASIPTSEVGTAPISILVSQPNGSSKEPSDK